MSYDSDKPIKSSKQDLLGRTTFSKQLGEAIYGYDANDGLVIGLYGKWGTGKTSILNLVINEINELSKKSDDKPIIVKFAPWNYTDKDNLISLFFRVLKNKLDRDKGEEKGKKIGKALTDYSDALDALSLVPMVGSGLAILLKTIAKAQGAELSKEVDLDVTRNHLEEVLSETHQKIIVIIDDIDRLTNSQIRDIFQLVKQVGNFPNIIYVLSMDRDVVCRALASVHNINGAEYLEKIIQIPFEIPVLMKSKLQEIFLAKLDNTVNGISNSITWDQIYWSEVFTNCIEPYIKTLRDVNRVINTFQFRYRLLYEETALEDMVALTTIEVLEPQLYQWIGNNKDLFCSTSIHSYQSMYRDKKDYHNLICNELESLGINVDQAIKFLSTLFPIFADDIYDRNIRCISSNIREVMRATLEDRFDSYFIFDLDGIPVSRYIINNCINSLDFNEIIDIITKINNEGSIGYFIEELRSLVNSITYNRLSLLASVILCEQHKFPDDNSRRFFMLSVYSKSLFLIGEIIGRIDNETERYKIIKDFLENINKNQLGTIANFINKIELAYGRLSGNIENEDKQLITLEHLEELERLYILKINEIIKSESIFEISQFYITFYLWNCLDKDKAKIYLENEFKYDINILKFICAIAHKWIGSDNDSGWRFSLDGFLDYISADTIYKKIEEFDKRQLDLFTTEDQIKLASFVLSYGKSNNHSISEKDAKVLIENWKSNV
ncbi:MAG: P-loop NTPase fold protein [Veillonella sp.]|nr:P-loop NTPase fold protein [Veillonella sp.]